MIASLTFALQSGITIVVGVVSVVVVAGGLIFYALYRMDDVRAEFAHGKTTFKLAAKNRKRR
jgi:hypothetical protein